MRLLVVFSICLLPVASRAEPITVENPSSPPQGRAEVALRPLWTVGGEAGDLLLGQIAAAAVAPDGTTYLLDNQLAEVQVISPHGEWSGSLGREGEGPGEFRNPVDLFLMPDGNLGVVQMMPGKVAMLTPQGEAIDDHRLPSANAGLRMIQRGLAFGNRLYLVSSAFLMQDGEMGQQTLLYAVDSEGEEVARFEEVLGGVDFATMSVGEEQLDHFGRYWAVDDRGRVIVAPHFSDYRLHVYAPDGTLERVVLREHSPRSRTEREMDVVRENFNMNVNGQDIEVLPQKVPRTIGGVFARAGGGFRVLLVDLEQDVEAGRVARLDEFDAEGNYLRQTVLTGPVDLRTDRIFLDGDRATVVHDARSASGEEDDLSEVEVVRVTAYALEPPNDSGR